MSPGGHKRVARALAQRCRAAAEVYLDELPEPIDHGAHDAGRLLDLMVRRVQATADPAGAWLTWTAVAGAFPTAAEVQEARRTIELYPPADAAIWLLGRCQVSPRSIESFTCEMDVLVGAVVPSVDYCARVEHHTGIQRVVRETLPRWDIRHDVHPVAWTDSGGIMRGLDDVETDRVLRWNQQLHVARSSTTSGPPRLVVPWRSNVVLIEVPLPQLYPALQGLAEYSGNEVTAVGYDAIPVVSADVRPYSEPDNYVQYLSVIKHAARISGISVSAAQEFRGFAEALPSQGLPAAVVTEAFLPGEAPHATAPEQTLTERPIVLCVGSQEQHKNHLAVLHAAEILWREGLDFEVQLIGRAGWNAERLEARGEALIGAGRPLTFRRGVHDQELWDSYRRSRFSVFASLHEGYGLPVAESLACGTPVITTNYGSTREIAEAGGCLLIDPRNDDELVAAMRSMLVDDALWTRLSSEARERPIRTWADYADELWEQLIGSEGDES
ncbi:glycosyltransferase [Actinotalea sp. K2]|uniref:glycosyltransferase n=1 Tax=Actinotalea sp. K2 TaxID=2939438 RepID=UPI002016D798|nr:glycosyltransferase [Actinotalea sp. K2]MCL3862720.1 glycosyltransferase [Actinotalea sp. K2]